MRGICIEKLIIYTADGRMKVQGYNYPSLNSTTEGWKTASSTRRKRSPKLWSGRKFSDCEEYGLTKKILKKEIDFITGDWTKMSIEWQILLGINLMK